MCVYREVSYMTVLFIRGFLGLINSSSDLEDHDRSSGPVVGGGDQIE